MRVQIPFVLIQPSIIGLLPNLQIFDLLLSSFWIISHTLETIGMSPDLPLDPANASTQYHFPHLGYVYPKPWFVVRRILDYYHPLQVQFPHSTFPPVSWKFIKQYTYIKPAFVSIDDQFPHMFTMKAHWTLNTACTFKKTSTVAIIQW